MMRYINQHYLSIYLSANITHASMVWHGDSGHHFPMAWWLEFCFCGQLSLSPGHYYPSSRIRSANETAVYSNSLQNKPRTSWRLQMQQALGDSDLCACGATQTMSHIVESCPLTKLDGGLKKLHTDDDESVDWLSSYGTWSAYANNNNNNNWDWYTENCHAIEEVESLA